MKDFFASIKWRILSYYTLLISITTVLVFGAYALSERRVMDNLIQAQLQGQIMRVLPRFFPPGGRRDSTNLHSPAMSRQQQPPTQGRQQPPVRRERQGPGDSAQLPSGSMESSAGYGQAPPQYARQPGAGSRRLPSDTHANSEQGFFYGERGQELLADLEQAQIFLIAFNYAGQKIYSSEYAPEIDDDLQLVMQQTGFRVFPLAEHMCLRTRTPGGFLVAGLPEQLAYAGLHKRLVIAGLIGLGGIVLSTALGYGIIVRGLRPIDQISNTARRIAAGNFSEQIDVELQRSELGQLAEVLNNSFQQVEETLQKQVQFTADASHELRTPVAAIIADCQFSLKRERELARYLETIEVAHSSAQHMKQIIEQLSQLAKFDSGSAAIEAEKVDLREIAERVLNVIRPLANEEGISLESSLRSMEVEVDQIRIGQVLINQLTNAVRYNKRG